MDGSNDVNRAGVCMIFHRCRLGSAPEMGSPLLYIPMACILPPLVIYHPFRKGPNSGSAWRSQRQKRRNSTRSLGNQLVDKLVVLFDEKRKKNWWPAKSNSFWGVVRNVVKGGGQRKQVEKEKRRNVLDMYGLVGSCSLIVV